VAEQTPPDVRKLSEADYQAAKLAFLRGTVAHRDDGALARIARRLPDAQPKHPAKKD